MKLAISISGNTLDSPFEPRFGRANAFCILDVASGEWSVHENPGISASGGAGVQAAQFIAGLDVQVVISGAFGPNAIDCLSPAGIEMYLITDDTNVTAARAVELFKAGKLKKAPAPEHSGSSIGPF